MDSLLYALAITVLCFAPGILLDDMARKARLTHLERAKVGLWALLSWPGFFIGKRKLQLRKH